MTPRTVAHQTSLSIGFSRQECWNGLPFPSPGDLHDPGIEPGSPALQADSLLTEPLGKPYIYVCVCVCVCYMCVCMRVFVCVCMRFPDSSVGKESACNAGDPGLIPGSGISAGEGIGYPFQYSWLPLWLSW